MNMIPDPLPPGVFVSKVSESLDDRTANPFACPTYAVTGYFTGENTVFAMIVMALPIIGFFEDVDRFVDTGSHNLP
jgi:hypothetical protein